jgi:hypothetical protein
MSVAEALRERRWLAAAFHRGWDGVQQVVFHRTPSKTEDLEALSLKLQSTLACRALEYALELETTGTPATEADLSRFLAARNSQARQPPETSDNRIAMTDFLRGLHGIIQQKADEFPDDPRLDVVRRSRAEALAERNLPPQRLRRRFAGC